MTPVPRPMPVPSSAGVTAVVEALQGRAAVAAVGGSGLLAALGLVERVRDWDVTTDAPTRTVEEALRSTGLPIADPAVWLRAYRLLGRHDRADLLQAWLGRSSRGG